MTDKQISLIWKKGIKVDGFDPSSFRKDACGAWIKRDEYGNHSSQYGWDVDHVYPKVLGGDDDIFNLRPLQWQNNLSKGDDFPYYFSAVSAQERNNVESVLQFKLNDDLFDELKTKYNF